MNQLTTSFFPELDWVMVGWICNALCGRGDADVLHEPYPLSNWRSPHFLIGPTDLRRPIRGVVVTLGFNPHRESADHLTRTDAVERSPVVAFAVHQTRRERIAPN